jgi:hypothetical protein
VKCHSLARRIVRLLVRCRRTTWRISVYSRVHLRSGQYEQFCVCCMLVVMPSAVTDHQRTHHTVPLLFALSGRSRLCTICGSFSNVGYFQISNVAESPSPLSRIMADRKSGLTWAIAAEVADQPQLGIEAVN